eukprot:TRINITY_DN17992_c0_g1_i1.p1 TRINITY_DN17992_c0_g1~~TRINITY_DN17992_c0_g1_i1.p1  ORF type:complete len:251 (-),score=58.62 TRINITY_DN17992_c0_g1_i1:9-761(-)
MCIRDSPSIFHILSHPAIEFYSLTKVANTLKIIMLAYSNTTLPGFKIAASSIVAGYKEAIRALNGSGFAAEIICHRSFIETLLRSLVINNAILFYNLDIPVLETLASTTGCIGSSIITQLCRMDKVLSETAAYIFKKTHNPKVNIDIFTMTGLLESKKPRMVMDVAVEIAKNTKTKAFPAGMEEEYVMMQYLVDTEVYETLVQTLKAMVFGPIYPNVLANVEYSLQVLSLIHICRCRRYAVCRSRWSPYH